MAAVPLSESLFRHVQPSRDMAVLLNSRGPRGDPSRFTSSPQLGCSGPLTMLSHSGSLAVGMSITLLLRRGVLLPGTLLAVGVQSALHMAASYGLIGCDTLECALQGGVDPAAAAAPLAAKSSPRMGGKVHQCGDMRTVA
jgi:hypothetical protein